MAICPNCKYEYEPEVFKCPDCDVALVSKLPDESQSGRDYKDWIPMVRLTSNMEAEMLLEVLRSKQIPSVILSGSGYFGATGQMGPSSFLPIGEGFVIAVPLEFVEQADLEGSGLLGENWEKSKLVDIE